MLSLKQAQYISNVCMKFNAKLGGATSLAITTSAEKQQSKIATLCIGADVSHAAPGSDAGSYAALTMSTNLECNR